MTESVMAEEPVEEGSYKRDQVIQIINSVIDKVSVSGENSSDALYGELGELKRIIDAARNDLAMERPSDIQGKHIPSATGELDEVVLATEEATGIIMDACEVIQQSFDKMDPSVLEAVEGAVTKIFEACSFQDITGQRITKVVSALQSIDSKVGRIMEILSSRMPGIAEEAEAVPDIQEDVVLEGASLAGPQSADKAISQDEIDKLLAEFD